MQIVKFHNARDYHHIIVIIPAIVLITVCSQASTFTPPLPTSVTPALTSSPIAAPLTPTAMTHIPLQEYLEGVAADWMEQVSDEQYLAGLSVT